MINTAALMTLILQLTFVPEVALLRIGAATLATYTEMALVN